MAMHAPSPSNFKTSFQYPINQMKSSAIFAIALARAFSAFAAFPTDIEVYPAKFKDGKKAAISFTFDDGDLDHYLLVAPELEKRGRRGTFWVIGHTF